MWKQCTKCSKYKALWEFNKHNTCSFGVRSYCKKCNIKHNIEYNISRKEYISKYGKTYRKNNKNIIIERGKTYRQNNKDKVNAKEAKRKALKLNQSPVLTPVEKILINRYYELSTKLNTTAGFIKYHVDHIIPLSKGGLHHPDNLQIITAKDNLCKSDKLNYTYNSPRIKSKGDINVYSSNLYIK